MELRKFISESINQICLGIRDAQISVSKEIGNEPIAPAMINGVSSFKKEEYIHFDIAVTLTDDEKLNAVGGLNIGVAGVGLKGDVNKQSSAKTENIHRINFQVPFVPQGLNTTSRNFKKETNKKNV